MTNPGAGRTERAPSPAGRVARSGDARRTLALVSGASHSGRDRTPGRVAAMVGALAGLGPVDLVVVHDDAAERHERRIWADRVAVPAGHLDRRLEVVARPLPPGGFVREVHRHRFAGPERGARDGAWLRVADAFVAAAPPDLVWCADLAATTRAGWLCPTAPVAVDLDRFEDLSSVRARRSARRTASTAHVVTTDSAPRRDTLALPGSIIVTPDGLEQLAARIAAVADQAAAYRPART